MYDLDLHGVVRVKHPVTLDTPMNKKVTFEKTKQSIVAKLAIYPHNSTIWLSAKNRYCVDWGDGKVQKYSSGQIVNHIYDFDQLPDTLLSPDGYKIVTVVITPQTRYNLTEINFDPIADDEDTIYLSTAQWIKIDISMPNLNNLVLTAGLIKNRHPLLKQFTVFN